MNLIELNNAMRQEEQKHIEEWVDAQPHRGRVSSVSKLKENSSYQDSFVSSTEPATLEPPIRATSPQSVPTVVGPLCLSPSLPLSDQMLLIASSLAQQLKLPAIAAQRHFSQLVRSFENQHQAACVVRGSTIARIYKRLEQLEQPSAEVMTQAKLVTHKASESLQTPFLWQDKIFSWMSKQDQHEEDQPCLTPSNDFHTCAFEELSIWAKKFSARCEMEIERIENYNSFIDDILDRWKPVHLQLLTHFTRIYDYQMIAVPEVRIFARFLAKDLKQIDHDIDDIQRAQYPWQKVLHKLSYGQPNTQAQQELKAGLLVHFRRFGLPSSGRRATPKEEQEKYACKLSAMLLSCRFPSAQPQTPIDHILYDNYRSFWLQSIQPNILNDGSNVADIACLALAGCSLQKPLQIDNPMYPRQQLLLVDVMTAFMFLEQAKTHFAKLDNLLRSDLFVIRAKLATALIEIDRSAMQPLLHRYIR